jgi:transcriptional regulator with XRE-family HTH domain
MKKEEKKEARRLRIEEGLSLKEIAEKLNVSRTSISYWVRDIPLTEEQRFRLSERCNYNPTNFQKGADANKRKFYSLREAYQKEGRSLVKNCDNLFIAGLMLFWAEGSKKRHCVCLTNSDPDLVCLFLKFLRDWFSISNEKITLSIQWYSANGVPYNQVENFWLKKLELSRENLRKCYIDNRSIKNIDKKIGKCPYGIARINISDVKLTQQLYGAIQEYVGFNRDGWLN